MFRLDPVLRQRQREEDGARRVLAEAQAALLGAEAELSAARGALDRELTLGRAGVVGCASNSGPRPASEFVRAMQGRHAAIVAAEARITRAEQRVGEARTSVEAERERLAEAVRRRRAIEIIREQRLREHERRERRREQATQDEIAARLAQRDR